MSFTLIAFPVSSLTLSAHSLIINVLANHAHFEDPRLLALARLTTPLWVFDTEKMRVVWANVAGLSYWGAAGEEELYTRDMSQDISDAARKRLQHIVIDCYEHNSVVSEIWTLYPRNLPPKTGEFSLSAFSLYGQSHTILIQVVTDISDATANTLHSTTALNHTAAMISLYDDNYRLLYANPAARSVLFHRASTLEETLVNDNDLHLIVELLESADQCTVELEINTIAGPRWHSMTVCHTLDALNGEAAVLVSATDATEKRHAQQVAYRLAYNDSLTGLPNRAAMNVFLDALVEDSDNSDVRFGLFFLDLDRFKTINDSLGHAAGDQLLIEVAQRLKKTIGAHGMVCRLGGDEFVVIINSQTEIQLLSSIANNIIQAMSEPLTLQGQCLRIMSSIGICRYPEDGNTITEIMEHADSAMYLAKAHQTGFCFYDGIASKQLSDSVKDRLGLESDLVTALEQEQFEIYYQPKICCKSLNVVGVEALIRWNHPVRGRVSPDEFIEIAEDTGQIVEIGNWVMNTAMQQQREWFKAGLIVPVSINISPRQFQGDELVTTVSDCLQQNRCDPAMIELEITESMLMGDADKIHQTLQQLSTMGIKLALDDFGTGYSNLAYLQRYPLDTLKIDRIFLADQKRSMLMGTILNMGKVLGLSVVAEGVETASQVSWLISRGCDQLQGFHFSKPLPATETTRYLLDNGAPARAGTHKAA